MREKSSRRTQQIARFLTIYARRSKVVVLNRRVDAVNADPDDDIVLATAVNGKATLIVTGDRHLLALDELEGIRIVTVDAALKILSTLKSD